MTRLVLALALTMALVLFSLTAAEAKGKPKPSQPSGWSVTVHADGALDRSVKRRRRD